jgi:hypothetical protein
MDPLLEKLKAEETRKKDLIAELEKLTRQTDVATLDEAHLKRELRMRMADAKSLLDRQRSEARQILRKLLDRPLQFEVFETDGQKGYQVSGQGSYLSLLPGSLAFPAAEKHSLALRDPQLVSPTGFEPVLLP